MIDLRSDTFTMPTEGMRRAMAEAELGDDVYGEDPTVRRLEEAVAERLDKEAAVFMPSGTMSNQIGVRLHTRPGDQAIAEATAHVYLLEGGGPAVLSGVTMRPLAGESGVVTGEQVEAAIPVPHPYMVDSVLAPVTLLCLENTHNLHGGAVWPLASLEATLETARRRGLATHLDGARLWNASVASGVAEAELAHGFDTVSVCFSKGLGAPVGSALAGSAEDMLRARKLRQNLGGGMRQAGLLAAAAHYAMQHQRDRLAEDHENARQLAQGLAQIQGIEVDTERVQTNIVNFEVTTLPAGEYAIRCHDAGVHVIPSGHRRLRAVTHLGISGTDIERALDILRTVLRKAE